MFIMEEETKNKNKADIRIVGVGGGGGNAIETMIKEGIKGVQFIAVNTDSQALENSSAEIKVQLGSKLTKGLGAGANPEVGRRAAVESYEEIIQVLQGADMVFITAGMGGGTGTGGAPLVAQAANELGLLTVGIVTRPFVFEGQKRGKQAEQGIGELRNYVDTLIVIPNEKLLEISEENTSLLDAFQITDNILLQAVKGIAELVSVPGLINLDFADIKTVMQDKGMALMGRGVSDGKDRAKKAIIQAISSPLLNGMSIRGAAGMIVNITASAGLSLKEVQAASSVLTERASDTADIIVGTVIDENMGDKLSVTVIATGFEHSEDISSKREPLSLEEEEEKPEPPREENDSFPEERALKPQEMRREEEIPSENPTPEEGIPSKEPISSHEIYEPGEDSENGKEKMFVSEESPMEPQVEELSDEPAPDEQSGSIETDNSSEQPAESILKSKERKSPRDILLSKMREYEDQKNRDSMVRSEDQISMDWKESQLEENPSSPFESSVDFSDEDMV